MNAEKAREYFSDYYEKQMTGAMLESFERVLRQDAQVQAEYRAFEETMESLSSLALPIPEPDFDLHERIAQRLDRHAFEQKQESRGSFWLPWRKLAFGGIAVVAIVGAIGSINMRNVGRTSNSSIVGPVESVKKPMVDLANVGLVENDGQWTFEFKAKGKDHITILDQDGKSIQSVDLNNEALSSPLVNQGAKARIVTIQFDSARNGIVVALPGTESGKGAEGIEGTGTLHELALASAESFGRPVIVAVPKTDASLNWRLKRDAQVSSILSSVSSLRCTVEESESGAIWIR